MKTENETVPNQSTEKTSSTSTTEWIRENTTPTIDILSETSSSPRISSSNLDGVVADCVVCGDKSSGKHYGQFSCEGCKSFFKRSIRRSLSYACRGTKNCPVDVNHRNQCQFCRLKKCVKMGMRRESVQQGRVHNVSPFLNCFLPSPFITTPRPSFPFVHPFMFNFTSSRSAFPQFIDSDDVRSSTNTTASASGACLSSRDIATNYLYSTIEWVRQLSFFNILTQHDQITLLQHNWAQLFILYVSGNSLPLQFSDESNAKDGNTYTDIIERIRSIHMDPFELNSIKAMVLFNPDTPSLQETLKIETLQEKVQTSLDEYCRSQKPHQLGRFGRILLRLPSLRTVNASTIETLFFSTFDVPIQMILNDLLNHSYMISKFWPYPMLPQFRIPSLS